MAQYLFFTPRSLEVVVASSAGPIEREAASHMADGLRELAALDTFLGYLLGDEDESVEALARCPRTGQICPIRLAALGLLI